MFNDDLFKEEQYSVLKELCVQTFFVSCCKMDDIYNNLLKNMSGKTYV